MRKDVYERLTVFSKSTKMFVPCHSLCSSHSYYSCLLCPFFPSLVVSITPRTWIPQSTPPGLSRNAPPFTKNSENAMLRTEHNIPDVA